MSGAPWTLRPSWRSTGLALAAYLVLLLLWCLPLLGQLTEASIGWNEADKQMHYWDLWWAHKGLSEPGSSFFFSDFIYAPPGASLWRSNAGFLLFLVATAPGALLGPIDLDLTYNYIALLCLFISCVGGYLLGVRLFKDPWVAFFTGLVTAYNPFTLFHLGIGLFEVANLGWAMLYIGALERLLDRRDLRSAFWAALWYMVAAAWCWYVGYVLVLLSALFFVLRVNPISLLNRERRLLIPLGLFGALVGAFLLLVSSQMGLSTMTGDIQQVEDRMVRAMAGQQTAVPQRGGKMLTEVSARIGLPDRGAVESLEVKLMSSVDSASSLNPLERRVDLSSISLERWLLPLLLAALAVFTRRDRVALFWATLAAVGAILSLGPCLVLNSVVIWDSCGWTPYALLARVVPGLSRVHFPQRLLLLSVLGVVVLSGYGLATLRRRHGHRPWGRRAILAGALLLAPLGSMSLQGYPPPAVKPVAPDVYNQLAALPGDFGVLEVPFLSGARIRGYYRPSRFAYYQTVHGKRRMFGSIPDHLVPAGRPAAVADNALVNRLLLLMRVEPGPGRAPAPSSEALRRGVNELASVGTRFILIHRDDLLPGAVEEIMSLMVELLGEPRLDRSLDGDHLWVFKLSAVEGKR